MDAKLGRRTFVVTSLATGYALAAQPVSAETISTDATGLTAGEVKIGQMPAYRAMPDKKGGKFPLVLVIHEIFGVHEHIKDLCRRLAKEGYMAVAPDLYARQGDVSKLTDFQEIFKIVGKVPDEQVLKDLDDTVQWARGTGSVDGDKLSAVGFCWGGRQSWLFAAGSRFAPKATAAFYGPVSNAVNVNQTKTVLDLPGKLTVPVIGFYGGKDTHIPIGQVEMLKMALASSTKSGKSEIHIYPNADHGFNADYRPMYNKEAATDAWAKMLAFFKANGAA